MKLLNNSLEYTIFDFSKTQDNSDIVVIFGESKPESLSGISEVISDNGFQLVTFDSNDFLRQFWNENALVLTNTPEPEPEPEPEPGVDEPTADEILNVMLGVTE